MSGDLLSPVLRTTAAHDLHRYLFSERSGTPDSATQYRRTCTATCCSLRARRPAVRCPARAGVVATRDRRLPIGDDLDQRLWSSSATTHEAGIRSDLRSTINCKGLITCVISELGIPIIQNAWICLPYSYTRPGG